MCSYLMRLITLMKDTILGLSFLPLDLPREYFEIHFFGEAKVSAHLSNNEGVKKRDLHARVVLRYQRIRTCDSSKLEKVLYSTVKKHAAFQVKWNSCVIYIYDNVDKCCTFLSLECKFSLTLALLVQCLPKLHHSVADNFHKVCTKAVHDSQDQRWCI